MQKVRINRDLKVGGADHQLTSRVFSSSVSVHPVTPKVTGPQSMSLLPAARRCELVNVRALGLKCEGPHGLDLVLSIENPNQE
jgi:hypothetical protein